MEGTKILDFLTDFKPARITRNTLFQNSLHTGLNKSGAMSTRLTKKEMTIHSHSMVLWFCVSRNATTDREWDKYPHVTFRSSTDWETFVLPVDREFPYMAIQIFLKFRSMIIAATPF